MRILYCHNYYRNRGGEDISFECDVHMLRERGHFVETFTRENSKLSSSSLSIAKDTFWNRWVAKDLFKMIERVKPDVLHCNNLFPQLSVSVYSAARKSSVPVIQALRNYRSFCANSFFFRDGEICRKCFGKTFATPAVRHRCYRDSTAGSAVVASMQAFHRLGKIQKRYVQAFFTPTEFARQLHIEGGFEAANIFVRNNFSVPDRRYQAEKENYAIFVGRLSPEKGVDTLIEAFRDPKISLPLKIVGGGPDELRLRERAKDCPRITFTGQLSNEEAMTLVSKAKFLIIPSRWYETFGRTILEAYSVGTPVIASRLGAMKELVDDPRCGGQFEPGDVSSLVAAIGRLAEQLAQSQFEMQLACRERYEHRYSQRCSYQSLLRIYHYAIARVAPSHPSLSEIESLLDGFSEPASDEGSE